jgi:hypothetical protein
MQNKIDSSQKQNRSDSSFTLSTVEQDLLRPFDFWKMSCGDAHYPVKTIKPPHLTIFFCNYIFQSMYNLVELLQIWIFLGKLVGQNFWEFFQNYSPATALKTLNRFSMQQVSPDFF